MHSTYENHEFSYCHVVDRMSRKILALGSSPLPKEVICEILLSQAVEPFDLSNRLTDERTQDPLRITHNFLIQHENALVIQAESIVAEDHGFLTFLQLHVVAYNVVPCNISSRDHLRGHYLVDHLSSLGESWGREGCMMIFS